MPPDAAGVLPFFLSQPRSSTGFGWQLCAGPAGMCPRHPRRGMTCLARGASLYGGGATERAEAGSAALVAWGTCTCAAGTAERRAEEGVRGTVKGLVPTPFLTASEGTPAQPPLGSSQGC